MDVNLTSVKVKRGKSAKHGKLVEALAIGLEQLNAENDSATYKGIKKRALIICTYCTIVLF